jgi:hypothetical protein
MIKHMGFVLHSVLLFCQESINLKMYLFFFYLDLKISWINEPQTQLIGMKNCKAK